MKAIFTFNIEEEIGRLAKEGSREITLFFIVFAINILVYGQKLFFHSLATDDYAELLSGGGEQASWLGRWVGGILSQYIFTGTARILPYFHGILGIFSFTLSGFLTAKLLKINSTFEIVTVVLLISATPFFAHNLYFNMNIATWISTLLGVVGLVLGYKSSKIAKPFGFILLVIAIGTYQSIIQVSMAIIVIKTIIEVIEAKDKKELTQVILQAIFLIALVSLAFAASNIANYLYMEYNNLVISHRYRTATGVPRVYVFFERILHMYRARVWLPYFPGIFSFLYKIIFFLSIIGVLIALIKSKQEKTTKIISIFLLVLLFFTIPLIIQLPYITGNESPIRAHYSIGFFMAGFFILQMQSFTGVFKTITNMLAISLIIINIYYINVFFYAANRQTNTDIIRANQVVSRIRIHENYVNEPIKFKIIGEKDFPVTGWSFNNRTAFSSDWSKNNIFKHFTDLNFNQMSDNEYHEVMDYLIEKDQKISPYPGKNSIVVYENKVVLFLDVSEVAGIER